MRGDTADRGQLTPLYPAVSEPDLGGDTQGVRYEAHFLHNGQHISRKDVPVWGCDGTERRTVAPEIKNGVTYFHGEKLPSDRHPQGWQGIVRTSKEDGATLVVVHTFASPCPETIRIELPDGCGDQVAQVYSYREQAVTVDCGADCGSDRRAGCRALVIDRVTEWEGTGVYLTS